MANEPNKSIIIANITWNPYDWKKIYNNPKAGHRYVKDLPGHESLNFKFDKPIDKNGFIHGYVQWTNPPKNFSSGGVVLFYTYDIDSRIGKIVGIYCNANILRPPVKKHHKGFEGNYLWTNIVAEERLSMLFSVPLGDNKYKRMLKAHRLVPQCGFRLADKSLAERVVYDEIIASMKSGMRKSEFKKLSDIYEYIAGKPCDVDSELENIDEKEQEEIIRDYEKMEEDAKERARQSLAKLKKTDPIKVTVRGKTYKRDNKTIAELKIVRGYKCQICSKGILKKNGKLYVEAAHIVPKRQKGVESPANILILCPNHHKEFDFGDKKIIKHNNNLIKFKMNTKIYTINLKIQQ